MRADIPSGPGSTFGHYLRHWRQRRKLSQLQFAVNAEISQRHLSFMENGRSVPSRDMLLHLAERLDIPLRERNPLLAAAGYAPVFPERSLDDPALAQARQALELVLRGHEPYPALVVDRHWNLVIANSALTPLLAGVTEASLLSPPVNVLRLSLHPRGLAPAIVNLEEWRAHLLDRLRRQIVASNDPLLVALMDELSAYPLATRPRAERPNASHDYAGIVVPLLLETPAGVLSFFSTTTIFGTPVDLTLAELALESFFPADAHTAAALLGQAGNAPVHP